MTRTGRYVLVVEDDEILLQTLLDWLGDAGYDAVGVTDGHEAMDHLRQFQHPGVILLDLLMPGMDGWEFCRRRQEDASLQEVPVVVLSSLVSDGVAERIPGVDAFLSKPADPAVLVDVVARYCLPHDVQA